MRKEGRVVFVVLLVMLLLVSLVSAVWWNPSTWSFFNKAEDVRLSPGDTCIDSDNGADIFTKSTLVGVLSNQNFTYTDACISNDFLNEGICNLSSSLGYSLTPQACAYGCVEGACNVAPVSVTYNITIQLRQMYLNQTTGGMLYPSIFASVPYKVFSLSNSLLFAGISNASGGIVLTNLTQTAYYLSINESSYFPSYEWFGVPYQGVRNVTLAPRYASPPLARYYNLTVQVSNATRVLSGVLVDIFASINGNYLFASNGYTNATGGFMTTLANGTFRIGVSAPNHVVNYSYVSLTQNQVASVSLSPVVPTTCASCTYGCLFSQCVNRGFGIGEEITLNRTDIAVMGSYSAMGYPNTYISYNATHVGTNITFKIITRSSSSGYDIQLVSLAPGSSVTHGDATSLSAIPPRCITYLSLAGGNYRLSYILGACVGAPSVVTCTDSDGGLNYTVVGTTRGPNANRVDATAIDSCSSPSTLQEHFCANSTLGTSFGTFSSYISSTTYACPSGVCTRGACVPSVACTSFTYSKWGACNATGRQNRTVATSSPTACVGGNPVLTQLCAPSYRISCAFPPYQQCKRSYFRKTCTMVRPSPYPTSCGVSQCPNGQIPYGPPQLC